MSLTTSSSSVDILYKPHVFFRAVHPRNTRGRVILKRFLGGNSVNSFSASTDQVEKFSEKIMGIPEVFFSTAAFLGRELFLNFDRTHCLHLRVHNRDTSARYDLMNDLTSGNIPPPSAEIREPDNLTLLWFLNKPFTLEEFHIYHLLQKYIYRCAERHKLLEENSEIEFYTRFPGTKTKSGEWFFISGSGKIHNKDHIRRTLLAAVSAKDYAQAQLKAGIFLELRALLNDLWWGGGIPEALYDDWIVFFGSCISYFSTNKELENELIAIAESLTNQKWKNIRPKFEQLILAIVNTAKLGYVDYGNLTLSTDYADWPSLIGGRVASRKKLDELQLNVLLGRDTPSPYLTKPDQIKNPFGLDEFAPLDRLTMSVV